MYFINRFNTPVIIHANKCGKTHKKLLNSTDKGNKTHISPLSGWFVLFKQDSRICGVDAAKPSFLPNTAADIKKFAQYIHVLTQ